MVEARTGKVNDNDSEEHNDLLRIYYGLTPRVFFSSLGMDVISLNS